MSRSYYEESRRELINRIEYLKNGNYVDFFRDSDAFILAMCIAYYGLTEDMMVKHDSKNGDIKTRLSTCIDKKYLKQLLDGDTGIVVRDREVNVILTDYDTNGNLSGVVKTNVSSLLKYFSHPVFERVVSSTKSSGGKKSK